MKSRTKKVIAVALATVVGLPVALVLATLACCWAMDRTNGTIVSLGLTRRYLLYVPASYERSKATPLVISLHPAATWPAVERNISGWNGLAEKHGFLVVYPAGTGAFFGGLGPGPEVFPMGTESLGRDVRFMSDLMDKLESEYNIDRQRIYVNGMSNGAGMAFALACKLPERIAAVGMVGAARPLEWERCGEAKPVPVVMFHGTADKFAPYLGGTSPIAPGVFPNIPEWTAQMAQRNRCQGGPSETQVGAGVRRSGYTNCANNADVVLYAVEGGGHTWPGSKPAPEWWAGRTTQEISATEVMWEFYTQHPRGTN